jgi:hypothetical protein
MNVHVEPDISGATEPCLSATKPLDTRLANKLLMKIVAASDLSSDLGRLEMNNSLSHRRLTRPIDDIR